jgi:tetratricopeptide (TPR) repeat protein
LGPDFPDPEVRELESLATGLSAELRQNASRIYSGQLAAAAENLSRTVIAHPQSTEAHLLLGAALLGLEGRQTEAQAQFQEAIHLEPKSPYVYFSIGIELAKRSGWQAAVPLFQKAIELAPDHEEAHANLAYVLVQQGKHDEAVLHYGEVLRIDPRELGAMVSRGNVLLELGRSAEALVDFQAAEELEPGNLEAGLGIARVLEQQGRHADALEKYLVLDNLALDASRRAWLQYRVGTLLGRQGQHPDALARFKQAVESDPDFLEARFNLAVALTRQGSHQEALEQFRWIVERHPNHTRARSGASSSLIRLGRYGEAASILEAGINLDSNQVVLISDLARILASCPDPSIRNGVRALELAKAAFAESGGPDEAEVVAMALAAAGQFNEAAEWQERVVVAAEREGMNERVDYLRRNLSRYRRGLLCCN